MKNIIVAAVIVMVVWVCVKVLVNDGSYALDRGEYADNPEAMKLYDEIVKNGDFNFDNLNVEDIGETELEALLLSFQKCNFKDDMSFQFDDKCKPFETYEKIQYTLGGDKLAALGRRLLRHPNENVRLMTMMMIAESGVYLNKPADIFNAADALNEGRIDYYLMFLMEHPEYLLDEDADAESFAWADYSGLESFYERCLESDNQAVKLYAFQHDKTPQELADSIEETDEAYQKAFGERKCYSIKDMVTKGILFSRCRINDQFQYSDDCRVINYYHVKDFSLSGIDNIQKGKKELIKMAKSENPQIRFNGYLFAEDDELLSLLIAEKEAMPLGLYINYYLDKKSLDDLNDGEVQALKMLTSHTDERVRTLAETVWNRLHGVNSIDEDVVDEDAVNDSDKPVKDNAKRKRSTDEKKKKPILPIRKDTDKKRNLL